MERKKYISSIIENDWKEITAEGFEPVEDEDIQNALEEKYSNLKPEEDGYEFISMNVTDLDNLNFKGILNYRIGLEQIQKRF